MTESPEFILRARRVLTPDGVVPASVHTRNGRITAVRAFEDVPAGASVETVPDALVLMPGLVDTHVHINEPGRTHWEGFFSATRAAAAGGVTTLVDMPLNSIPPTTTPAGLWAKLQSAEGKLHVDLGLCGGIVPGNARYVREMARAGALAFKCFLSESGVDEFPHVSEHDLRVALPVMADVGVPLFVHAELSGPIDAALAKRGPVSEAERAKYVTYLESRPRAAENEAVALMIKLSHELHARTHIVHLSSSDALLSLRDARDRNVPITAETCPHYLHLTAEQVPDGDTAFKCAPPIRERANRERLWTALADGLISQVVTDHSPATASLKCADTGDFLRAWGGISSLQLGLAVVWTEARDRLLSLAHVARWMSEAPARRVGLYGRKGALAPGFDADMIAFDPDALFTVDPAALQHKNPLTPYARRALFGRVRTTWLRGARVHHEGAFTPPRGRWISREQ